MARREYEEPRRRWGLRLGIVVLLLGVLVWFLPAIVAKTSLRQQIAPWAVPELAGKVTIGSASLGWLSPVELREIDLRDPAGGPVATVSAVTTSRALWQLALQSSDLGVIRVERPEVNLVVRSGGSNLEDVIRPVLEAPSKKSDEGPPPAIVLEIVNGKILLAEASDHEPPAATPATAAVTPPVVPTPDTAAVPTPDASAPHLKPPAPTQSHVASRAISTGTIDQLNAKLTIAPGQAEPLTAKLDCMVIPANAVTGNALHAEAKLKAGADAANLSADAGEAGLKFSAVEIAALSPVLTRLAVPLQVAGSAEADLSLQWSGGDKGPTVALKGPLTVQRLAVASPRFLGEETLRLEKLEVQPRLDYAGGQIHLKDTRAECDVGFAQASGDINLASWSGAQDVNQALSKLAESQIDLKGEVDCAALAKRLPGLVRLKADTRIDAGKISVALRSGGEAGRRRLEGTIKAAGLVATAGGRRVEYPQPIQIDGSLQTRAGGDWLAKAQCKSDYLTADAEGSLYDVTGSLEADLNRLTTDIGQIVDFGQLKAAGRIVSGFEIRRKRPAAGTAITAAPAPAAVTANGNVLLEGFQLQAPGLRPWDEPRLTAAFTMRGTMDAASLTRLEEGELRVDSGSDHLLATLTQPVDKPQRNSAWPVKASMEGNVAAWLARVQPWLPLTGWQLSGAARCTAEATVSTKSCDVKQAHLQLQDFKAVSSWLNVDEPRVEWEGVAQWDGPAGRIAVPTMTLATSSVSLRADQVLWQLDSQNRRAAGQVAVRSDLARLSRWFEVPGQPPKFRLTGVMLGRVQLSEAGGALKADVTAEAENFVAFAPAAAPTRTAGPAALPATSASPWQAVWSESKISVAGGASYKAAEDRLDLDQFTINSNVLRLANLRGSITDVAGRRLVDLSGEVHYDLAKITPLLTPYVGTGVHLVGQGHRDFALKGPLTSADAPAAVAADEISRRALAPGPMRPQLGVVPPELQGHAGIGFQQARVYGLVTGPGELKGDLAKQVVQLAPLQLAIGQGRFAASPRIELMSSPLLIQEPGRVVDQLDMTPELCQTWLKYVAPMLADATRADGKFSVDLSRCRVPLSDTTKSDVAGTFTIHSASVRPGPVAVPIVGVARQIEALVQKKPLDALGGLVGGQAGPLVPGSDLQLNIESQAIQFAVRDGRVTHSPLKIVVGNVEIRTSGSVGFDQSLDLVADVPILPPVGRKAAGPARAGRQDDPDTRARNARQAGAGSSGRGSAHPADRHRGRRRRRGRGSAKGTGRFAAAEEVGEKQSPSPQAVPNLVQQLLVLHRQLRRLLVARTWNRRHYRRILFWLFQDGPLGFRGLLLSPGIRQHAVLFNSLVKDFRK